ncbi:MAG: glycoside hydrolase family 16 protein [Ferruginibacter sp.]
MRIACLLFLILSLASCSTSHKTANADDWKLSWSEEFNYDGLPDSTKWSYDVGGHGWGNNELEYYTNGSLDNATVSDGTLKIKVVREKKGDREYTSTRMHTKGKADFTYGKIEIKAKLPSGRGIWPAIWMLGSNIGTVDWPDCGEIDIMEHVGFDKDTIVGTVHTKSYNHVKGTQKGKKVFIKDPYNTYHLYAIEWTPEGMGFLLDNVMYYHIANEHKTVAEWPFDSPFYLLLNVAVGGNWGGQKGVDPTIFPAAMEIDYVRVYTPAKSWSAITNKKL